MNTVADGLSPLENYKKCKIKKELQWSSLSNELEKYIKKKEKENGGSLTAIVNLTKSDSNLVTVFRDAANSSKVLGGKPTPQTIYKVQIFFFSQFILFQHAKRSTLSLHSAVKAPNERKSKPKWRRSQTYIPAQFAPFQTKALTVTNNGGDCSYKTYLEVES